MRVEITIGDLKLTESESNIEKMEFVFDSPEDAKAKSLGAIKGLKLTGKIDEKSKKETLELGKWALCESGEGIYRKVNVLILDASGEVLREYKFSSMFVVDYIENYETTKDKGPELHFMLELRQKQNESGVEIKD